jgi:diguanylate cyclase (GGDEF)-like protein/PAS domain S-box-containing protein
MKILLIEDNQSDAHLIENIFQKNKSEKIKIVHVQLWQNAINYLQQDKIDVILLDLSLSNSLGVDEIQQIQKIASGIPLILLTDQEDEQNALKALQLGAQDYLFKAEVLPSNFSFLIRRIYYAIERQNLVQKLRKSEARYRAVVEEQTELICRFLPDGTLTFVNAAYCRHFNQSVEQLLGQNIRGIVFLEDLELFESALSSLSPQKPNSMVEFRVVVDTESKIYWQQWQNRAIFQGKKITEYQAVGRDITAKKLTEISVEREQDKLISYLYESEESLRILVDNAPVLIWMTNAQGEYTFCNRFCLNFLGIRRKEYLNSDWFTYIAPEDRSIYHKTYQSAFKNCSEFQIECRLLRFDGKYRWILITGIPKFDSDSNLTGFINSGIDITQLKTAEELLVQKAQRDRALTKTIQHIHTSLDLEIILHTAIEAINQILPTQRISLAKVIAPAQVKILYQDVNQKVDSNCGLSCVNKKVIPDLETNWQKLQRGEIVTVENPAPNDLNSKIQSECLGYSSLHIPLIVEQKLWGLLSIEKCSAIHHWQFNDVEILQQIALQLAVAIQQSELYQQLAQANQELEQLAVVDSLTGIANRRKFDEYLQHEWLRLAREQAPLSLIMCDVDFFKLYNDTYGHQAGDRCLHQIAQALSKTIKRPADLAARYGGEELAVILPHTTPEGAAIVANQISLQIKALKIPHINSPIDLYVTISMGVSGCIPTHDSSPEWLIKAADRALYQAKKSGRNQIILASENLQFSGKS